MHLQKRDYKKKSFSLIEVLFSIIVISIIISSIPNLMETVNLSIRTIINKDILYKTLNETMKISVYRWDEHSEDNYSSELKQMWFNKILDTNSSNFQRIEGTIARKFFTQNKVPIRQFFTLDRFDNNITRISASPIDKFHDIDETHFSCFDDLDDWNGSVIPYNENRINFHLKYFVNYIEDNISGLTDAKSSEIFIDFNFQETSFTSNLKYLKIIGQSDFSDEVFYFDYIAANVGEEGLVWKKRLVSGSSAHLKYFVSKKEETICE
jgi:competence protein ComGC